MIYLNKEGKDFMETNYVISDITPHTPFRVNMRRFNHEKQQMHDYFEVSMIVGGSCSLLMDQQLFHLSTGDVFTVNPHTIHELNGVNCISITLLFNQTIFEQILPNPSHPSFFCVSSVNGESEAIENIRSLLVRIVKNNVDKFQGFELRNWSYIYNLMDVLYNNFRLKNSNAKEKKNYKYSIRISQITSIIQNRFKENLTLNDMAKELYLSVPYLSKFFLEQYGMNFLTYLNQYRLNSAVLELSTSDKNIDQIAIDNGFSSSHSFVTAFKKEYGKLPNVYRRELKKNSKEREVVIQQEYIESLKKYLKKENSTKIKNAEKEIIISGDDSITYPLHHTWKNIMTIGTASDLLIADIQDMVKIIQKEIGFKYIRISGIFSDDLLVYSEDINGNSIYNFAYIDKILDFLYTLNIKPFIHLSYMPELLAKHPSKIYFNKNTSQPKSNTQWCNLIREFFKHIINKFGLAEVVTWKYSLWNQPNTNDLFSFDKPDDFFYFYKATYECIKNISNELIFCLPPTYYIVADNYQNWYMSFIERCKKENCLPDCLSFTYYDTRLTRIENNSKESFGFVCTMALSDNPDQLKDFVFKVREERKQLGINKMPIYLSEWNNTPSHQDLLNDTCFKSCYIVKNILENYDRLDSFAYWSLTDLMNDAPLPDKMLFGGLGLFTTSGLPKASYYAFSLLNKLGNRFIGRGDGYFVTKEKNNYKIMLYNYKHFSNLYANGERFDMTDDDRYSVFGDKVPVDLHIKINDLKNNEYLIKETFINRAHGSLYDVWTQSGCIEPNSAEDLNNLKNLSYPGIYKRKIKSDNNTLNIDITLDLLEVRLIELIPID